MSFVPQKINLIDDTIKNNICFGYDEDSIDNLKLEKAIDYSELKFFLASCENGIETNIGYDGSKISGGQLQRIGIARALYRSTNMIVLDEPTNALDHQMEEKIIKKLFDIKDITVLMISHNPKILQKCDQIINLEKKYD